MNIILPVISQVDPDLIAKDIISVQPIMQPTGKIFNISNKAPMLGFDGTENMLQ